MSFEKGFIWIMCLWLTAISVTVVLLYARALVVTPKVSHHRRAAHSVSLVPVSESSNSTIFHVPLQISLLGKYILNVFGSEANNNHVYYRNVHLLVHDKSVIIFHNRMYSSFQTQEWTFDAYVRGNVLIIKVAGPELSTHEVNIEHSPGNMVLQDEK